MKKAKDQQEHMQEKREDRRLTVEDVNRLMGQINSSRESAMQFLKEIGVTFTKSGKVNVRPI